MSCTPSDYAKPAVEIGPLATVASEISQAIGATGPNGNTPTLAALAGAIEHAKEWATAHPQHVVVDIIATDGQPHGCEDDVDYPDDIDHITKAASDGLKGTPSIRTFVIGVTSPDSPDGQTFVNNLKLIAQSGANLDPFLVDTTQDVNAKFLEALNQIRGAALGCTYSIPTPQSGEADLPNLSVLFTPSGGTTQSFGRVADTSQCPASGDGWCFNSASSPTQIILCPSSCTKVSADTKGQVDIRVPCKGETPPPPN